MGSAKDEAEEYADTWAKANPDKVKGSSRRFGAWTGIGAVLAIVIIGNLVNYVEESRKPTPTVVTKASPKPTTTSAFTKLNQAPVKDWYPKGYEIWSENSNIAWRWLKGNEFKCSYGDSCWGMIVIAKTGCRNGLYVELSLLDRNDIQVGYTNEVMSSALPLQKSKLIFNTFNEEAYTGRISEINCY